MLSCRFVSVALACLAPLLFARSGRAQDIPPIPSGPPAAPLFTDRERTALVAYWNAPNRYKVGAPPDAAKNGPWQVRLTPEGSLWFWNYQRIVGGNAKLPPTIDPRNLPSSGHADWEPWIAARVAWDKWQAQQAAVSANAAFAYPSSAALAPPPVPGPIPPALLTVCGNPPLFASIVAPLQYTVSFNDPATEMFVYTDNAKMRDRYAYYRFAKGVVTYGKRLDEMRQAEQDTLFSEAGFSPGEQRIFSAISKLEGGFETVQTYDTGYVSIGFIQFVTLIDGKADLSNVLMQEKTDRPTEFADDFHKYGLDVRPDLTMVAVDPATGAELSGAEAVMKIIDDKRLTAIFQRAGRKTPFRVAQIKVAKSYYWPESDPVRLPLGENNTLNGTVGQIIKSEAGLATLLDRKINTGNIRPFADVVVRVLKAHKVKSLDKAGDYEREIITALKYRADFLADKTLSQPK